jgi:hypothetical protein
MKTIAAALILLSVSACSSPLEVAPVRPTEPTLNVTTQAKPVPNLVIEILSGDCTTGITVQVRGENLSPKSRFGVQFLNKSDLTGFPPAQVALGTGNKKTVSWTTFWPSSMINPSTGAKFTGTARGVVTDAWTGWVHDTGPVSIGPAC